MEVKWKFGSISVMDSSAAIEQAADNGNVHLLRDIKLLSFFLFLPFGIS